MIRPSQWVLRALCEYNRFRYRLKARRWQGRGYDVPYLQSSGERSGSTLVFLHGLGASKDQWGPHIYSMVRTHNCVFLDLPGEGESWFDNSHSYCPEAQVERLKAFFDAQRFNDLVLIGSSIGGCIACLYAACYPADVSRLIALAPAGLPAAQLSPAMSEFLESGRHPFGYRTVDELQGLWATVFTRPPKVPAFLARALAIKGALRYARVGKILSDFQGAGLYPLQLRLKQVEAPTLIVWGRNDRVFDVSCLHAAYSLLPQASICIIEEAGHVPYLECAEQTVDALKRFLSDERCPHAGVSTYKT
ncbi:alpha/beta fold hydrolase [Pseudomonas marginalis]|uniref:alpha/beta fold hydrolase n=1 Tax=Pseudomonas marginalis TaxID=298 RepID=UPI0005FAEEAB|nr:alpha/beta hydrolase [Pseudomonas marginalis]KJZ51507.1 alpha/beta hydrolase [Pseudomonas marginalis]KJZ60690.1 alpha/beta hydrolase [Pseudomonas marginalis]WPN25156.1 alpha/beta hydrolase [Pseudomonas marginalis]